MVRVEREKPKEKDAIDTGREGPSKQEGVGNDIRCYREIPDDQLSIGFPLSEGYQ